MRQIALDTETTGMEVESGHRVIEIGCIEIVQRVPTGRRFHAWLNPDRDSDPRALEVHGLTREFLADKPRFGDVVLEFLDFLEDAELLIHNAAFDLGFLNNELELIGSDLKLDRRHPVIDTLKLARERHPGQRNSLDALCKRYQIDNSARNFHGALLDARLLADVYLAMTAGQGSLVLDLATAATSLPALATPAGLRIPRRLATVAERSAHAEQLERLEKKAGAASLWRQWLAEESAR